MNGDASGLTSFSLDSPAWRPSDDVIARANITACMRQFGIASYAELHAWSIRELNAFWRHVIDRLGIRFHEPFTHILEPHPTRPRWLPAAVMNIVDSCFQADSDAIAVVEGKGGELRRWTYGDLQSLTARIANGLIARGVKPGDAVAVVMPMSARAVATYLGIIATGASVVSIADSFAGEEIATRVRIGGAGLLFTQQMIEWGSKKLALYEKITALHVPPVVLLPSSENAPAKLRANDVLFDALLSVDDSLAPVARAPQDAINILFSSGTTGDPKAIPWDHTTPIKCGADAHFHQDLHPGDVACWPTNLGWMMGPWLIFASMLNRATMAIYQQAPTDAGFGEFIQRAGVTMLGVVPSLVRGWRQSKCMEGRNWSKIRAFSSSGECSNPSDMLYLMQLAGNRPIIEYCGGTEIGGGYVTGTVVQPCIPSTFSTPALGLNFALLDDEHQRASKGEAFITCQSIGLSTRLLNRDHESVYFAGTPTNGDGSPMRRHGDELEALPGGYFRVAGRSDDTMNLNGVKVGCAEIERVINQLPGVSESAAVAIPPPGGGPGVLVIFVVPTGNTILASELKTAMQQAIRAQLNPLFQVAEVRLIDALPRTTSNKVMRRELRLLCTPPADSVSQGAR